MLEENAFSDTDHTPASTKELLLDVA